MLDPLYLKQGEHSCKIIYVCNNGSTHVRCLCLQQGEHSCKILYLFYMNVKEQVNSRTSFNWKTKQNTKRGNNSNQRTLGPSTPLTLSLKNVDDLDIKFYNVKVNQRSSFEQTLIDPLVSETMIVQ